MEHASGEDLLLGMLHAYLLRQQFQNEVWSEDMLLSKLALSYDEAKMKFPGLLQQLREMGWRTETDVTTIEPNKAVRFSVQR